MNSVYEKLSVIISQILLYSNKVHSIVKPVFKDNFALVVIKDENGMSKDIVIPYARLLKVHDYLLYGYIFEIMKENDLL